MDEVSVFSLQWRIRNGGEPEQHRQDMVEHFRDFQPNFVLMQHLGSTGLTDGHFRAMRSAAKFEFIYHEADPYSRFLHPLPGPARAAGRSADVTFTVGSGVFAENFRRAGSHDVRWSPHVFEPDRYRYSPVSNASFREHDVVVVANRNRPRFRGHPNWRDRIDFVTRLQERFGDRLAIYGHGWTGVGAMGPIEFSRQNEAIRSAWVSANWDHYAHEPQYFSNRLPISLAAGSIHATSWHPGYEDLFQEETKQFLLYRDSRSGLIDAIEELLSATTPEERIQAGIRGQEFAYRHYRQDDQLVSFFNYRGPRLNPIAASEAWDLDENSLSAL
ncbi:glycosyltransferase family protein [Arthrobacter sp. KN11-1C]|uniref:glycosyltransferase family protein n=1 Tax=Arthrobacter sp. KN11-1C TaxID=3445774 RepID=UPI003F9F34EA